MGSGCQAFPDSPLFPSSHVKVDISLPPSSSPPSPFPSFSEDVLHQRLLLSPPSSTPLPKAVPFKQVAGNHLVLQTASKPLFFPLFCLITKSALAFLVGRLLFMGLPHEGGIFGLSPSPLSFSEIIFSFLFFTSFISLVRGIGLNLFLPLLPLTFSPPHLGPYRNSVARLPPPLSVPGSHLKLPNQSLQRVYFPFPLFRSLPHLPIMHKSNPLWCLFPLLPCPSFSFHTRQKEDYIHSSLPLLSAPSFLVLHDVQYLLFTIPVDALCLSLSLLRL